MAGTYHIRTTGFRLTETNLPVVLMMAATVMSHLGDSDDHENRQGGARSGTRQLSTKAERSGTRTLSEDSYRPRVSNRLERIDAHEGPQCVLNFVPPSGRISVANLGISSFGIASTISRSLVNYLRSNHFELTYNGAGIRSGTVVFLSVELSSKVSGTLPPRT